MKQKAVVFEPHDDDLIIGMGGTALQLLEENWNIKSIHMTDGRHGHDEIPPEKLVEIRKKEKQNEVDLLNNNYSGELEWEHLELEDGNLENLDYGRISSEISKILEDYKPEYTFVPSKDETHPDHRATYQIAEKAIKKAGNDIKEVNYIVWQLPFQNFKLGDIESVYQVDIDDQYDSKQEAVLLHESQEESINCSKVVDSFNSYLADIYQALNYETGNKAEVIGSPHNSQRLGSLTDYLEAEEVTESTQGRPEEDIR